MSEKTIRIPFDLARLLIAKPEDFIDKKKYREVKQLANTLLKVLMESQK